jgi:hypothetical protein
MFNHNKEEKKSQETILIYIVRLLLLSLSGGVIIGFAAGIALKMLKFYFNNYEVVQFY